MSAGNQGFWVSSEEGKIVAKLHKKLGIDGAKKVMKSLGAGGEGRGRDALSQ